MKKIKNLLTLENLLSIFIIICPILDIASFLFRNKFNTSYSISTFLRPIIPMVIFAIIFLKQKNKMKLIGIIGIYAIYGLIHLYIYNGLIRECTFGTTLHEAQYIVNYSFMILCLFIFNMIFLKNPCKINNKDNETDSTNKLEIFPRNIKKSLIIALSIYIISIYISIITNTSSSTYIEEIGYKGWFESGNSISAILVIGVFIVLSFITKIKNKKEVILICCVLGLIGIYLMTLIGTRVGLIGFALAIVCFVISQIFGNVISKSKINKKSFIALFTILILIVAVVITGGSITLKRRQHLKDMEETVLNEETGEISHLTGDLTEIRNKIVNNELEENFMTEEQRKSILDLYDIAEKYNISNTNTRVQQLIYHIMLIKNQKNILLILFGNGYLVNTNELVLEMEFPAFLFNFGIIGFILYMVPFLMILFKALKIGIKNLNKIDAEYVMLLFGVSLSFVLSTLSGYTFFNSSSMIIIIIANVLLLNKIKEVDTDCKK